MDLDHQDCLTCRTAKQQPKPIRCTCKSGFVCDWCHTKAHTEWLDFRKRKSSSKIFQCPHDMRKK